MASSRKTATNENISTYGGVGQGRDYTSLATWESATDIDLVAAAQSEVLECYDDETSFDDNILFRAAVTSSSYFRIVRPASGQGHDGTPNNGVYFLSTTAATIFSIDEGYTQVQDVIGKHNISTPSDKICCDTQFGASNEDQAFVGCIMMGDGNAGAGTIKGFQIEPKNTGQQHFAINCLALRCDDNGFDGFGSETAIFYNCTAIDCLNGFAQSNGTMIVTNCLADGSTTSDFTGTLTESYNASGDATAGGTGSRINQTFTFVNAGGDDYHLASGDAGAKDYGTDLSADGDYAFDDDIDGETRT